MCMKNFSLKPRIIDFLENGVAYYFAKDRNYPEPGYTKHVYQWEHIGLKQKGITEIYVKGEFKFLLDHWNSRDHRWFFTEIKNVRSAKKVNG